MDKKEILLEYMTNFRVECHVRLDMVPSDIAEFPIFMYKAAHEVAKEKTLQELNITAKEIGTAMDNIIDLFVTKLQELDHYGKADDLITRMIESDKF